MSRVLHVAAAFIPAGNAELKSPSGPVNLTDETKGGWFKLTVTNSQWRVLQTQSCIRCQNQIPFGAQFGWSKTYRGS
jgi:hypothetical protein